MKFLDDFHFKKQFGQNFIFDKVLLSSIVNSLNFNNNTNVLEIGAGAGVLTEVLAENFNKVVSFEIDNTLISHLQTLQQNHKNLSFVFNDVLKVETSSIDKMFNGEYSIIANLPYYITSQIIFKFLFESNNIKNIAVMVQKEVAERFCAKISTKAYGIPTVLINSFGCCTIVKNVPRTVFTPVPNVDSCVINISVDKNKFNISNKTEYINFVSNCFKMKRKTLYNNLTSFGYDKNQCINVLNSLNLQQTIRPENLTAEQYVNLFNTLTNNNL